MSGIEDKKVKGKDNAEVKDKKKIDTKMFDDDQLVSTPPIN